MSEQEFASTSRQGGALLPSVAVTAAALGLAALSLTFPREGGSPSPSDPATHPGGSMREPSAGMPTSITEALTRLDRGERMVSGEEIVQALVSMAKQNQFGLTPDNLEATVRSVADTTRYLTFAREVAAAWIRAAEDGCDLAWAISIVNSGVAGALYPKPNSFLSDGISVSHVLRPKEAADANVAWQDVKVTAELFGVDGALVGTTWLNVSTFPRPSPWVDVSRAPLLVGAAPESPYEPGMTLILRSHVTVYGAEEEPSLRTVTRTTRYAFESSSSGSIEGLQRNPDGSEITPLTQQILTAYDSLLTLNFRRSSALATPDATAQENMAYELLDRRAPELSVRGWTTNLPNAIAEGQTLNLADGNVRLIDFWASWCPPCLSAMGKLSELEQKNPDLQVLSVAGHDARDHKDIEGIARQWSHAFAIAGPDTFSQFRVQTYPTLVLVDGDGIVRWVGLGGSASPPPTLLEALLEK